MYINGYFLNFSFKKLTTRQMSPRGWSHNDKSDASRSINFQCFTSVIISLNNCLGVFVDHRWATYWRNWTSMSRRLERIRGNCILPVSSCYALLSVSSNIGSSSRVPFFSTIIFTTSRLQFLSIFIWFDSSLFILLLVSSKQQVRQQKFIYMIRACTTFLNLCG